MKIGLWRSRENLRLGLIHEVDPQVVFQPRRLLFSSYSKTCSLLTDFEIVFHLSSTGTTHHCSFLRVVARIRFIQKQGDSAPCLFVNRGKLKKNDIQTRHAKLAHEGTLFCY